ncbi:MAG: hypothetical protein JRI80_10080 [Deltaproteobacteria bacterium]|nr:hypothetical protein [Deltaproteobacteria bacterium]
MKNWPKQNRFLLLLILALISSPLYAHGVKGTIDRGGICITAQYDTDEVMSYAKVTIRPPGKGLDFQTGRTDRNGRFCFFPDGNGDWEVIVDDGMGHRLELAVPIDPKSLVMGEKRTGPSTRNALSKPVKALMGVCIIFGISGCLLWWMSKKRDQK